MSNGFLETKKINSVPHLFIDCLPEFINRHGINRMFTFLQTKARNLIRRVFPILANWLDRAQSNREFAKEFIRFTELQNKTSTSRFEMLWEDRHAILDEKTEVTYFDAHYIYHPAWAARILSQLHPEEHVDISSTLNFSTMVSAFIPTKFYDYRIAPLNLSNLESKKADLTNLPFSDNSIKSLSCMHVVEHIGLGRYGDPLDPDGDLKAIMELTRVIPKGGTLLFVVPVGRRPKIYYNAHRVYTYQQIASYFAGFYIAQFALIDDQGRFIQNTNSTEADRQNYGCGCWHFIKN